MAGKGRYCPGGYVYHVPNRSAGRIALFRRDEDCAAFERVMLRAFARVELRIILCLSGSQNGEARRSINSTGPI